MNKEVLFLEGSWNSSGSDELNIDVELKSNNDFHFFIAAITATPAIDLSVALYAEVYMGIYVIIDSKANIGGTSQISMITLHLAKGKYRVILLNDTATAVTVKYRYQFTQN